MQALQFHGPHDIEIKDLNIPLLQKDELLIHVDACGVCGTDFHIYEGNAPAANDVVLGHEYTGKIIDKGSKNIEFGVGDRVAINPNIHCGYCEFCRKGKINLCKNLKALGVTLNGGMSQFSIVPAAQTHILPADFPYNKSIFAEPLSCCVHGINQASIELGDKVAIVGAGAIGLIMLQLAQLKGASEIIVLDPVASKRKMAEQLNADYTLDPMKSDFTERYEDYMRGGADIVIECVGSRNAAETSVNIAKKGATVVLFGLAGAEAYMSLYLQKFFHKEITLKSSLLNPNTFQTAVDLLVNGSINVEVFNPFPVQLKQENISALFGGSRDASIIKYMVTPNN